MKTALISVMTAFGLLVAGVPAVNAQESAPSADSHDVRGDHSGRRGYGRHRGGMDRSFKNPERFAERLQKRLQLDDLQRQAISNALLAAQPQAEALREASQANRKAMRALDSTAADFASRSETLAAERGRLAAESASLHAAVRADIEAQLTPEQREKMAEAMTKRHEGRGKKRHRKGEHSQNQDEQSS